MLQSKDCHALWVSSKMLEMSMPFPSLVDGGVIVRNGTGHPTGKTFAQFTLNFSNRVARRSFGQRSRIAQAAQTNGGRLVEAIQSGCARCPPLWSNIDS